MSLATLKTKVEQLIEKAQNSGDDICYTTLENFTNWSYFCANNQGIAIIERYPDITKNGTDFSSMFNGSDKIKIVPLFNTSKAKNMSRTFYSCTIFTELPTFDTSNVENFDHTFATCINLTSMTFNSTSKGTKFYSLFSRAYKLVEVYGLDVSNATSVDGIFFDCFALETVHEPLNFAKAGNLTSIFNNCGALKNVRFVAETLKKSVSFAQSPLLTIESKQSIFDGLATVTTATTLTLNANTKILQSQVDAANAKGWTVAGGTIVSEEEYYG